MKFEKYLKEGSTWEKYGKKYDISTQDYDIVIEGTANKWKVYVTITRNDTVDQYGLNDVSDEWNQEKWGYEILGSNKKQLKDLLKLLKISALPKTF